MSKITLIVGAGANKEISQAIDIGSELIRNIADRVTDRTSPGRGYLSKSLINFGFDPSVTSLFAVYLEKYICSSDSPMIDEFLGETLKYPEFVGLRDDFENIGRMMIISHVFGWEGSATKESLKNEISEGATWLSELRRFVESSDDEVNVITFNYDRILEYFLLQETPSDRINSFLKNIHHVYGRIDFSNETENMNENEVSNFGHQNDDFKTIFRLKDSIKLINSDRDEANIEVIKKIINASDKIIVFGYGLDPINNRRLGIDEIYHKKPKQEFHFNIYPNIEPRFEFKIRRQMANKVRAILPHAKIEYKSCVSFLRDCIVLKTNLA